MGRRKMASKKGKPQQRQTIEWPTGANLGVIIVAAPQVAETLLELLAADIYRLLGGWQYEQLTSFVDISQRGSQRTIARQGGELRRAADLDERPTSTQSLQPGAGGQPPAQRRATLNLAVTLADLQHSSEELARLLEERRAEFS